MTPKVEIIRSKPVPAEAPASKAELKRRVDRLQMLGERLTKLSDGQLNRLTLPDEIRDAVADARSFTSKAAIRRQIQFIGRLMEFVDAAKIIRDLDDVDVRSSSHISKTLEHPQREFTLGLARDLLSHGVDILYSKYAGNFDNVAVHQISRISRQSARNVKNGADQEAEISQLAEKINPLVPAH